MGKKKIKNIIFDIGNVISRFDWKGTYESFGYDDEMVRRIAKATTLSPDWKEIDRGVLTTEEVMDRFVANDPEIESDIRHALSDISLIVKPVDYAKPWLKELKDRGYKCYFLSNFSEVAEKYCSEALSFMPLMDGGILSYREQVIKPDVRIYELLLKRYSLDPEESVFLDDTAENLPPAESLGIRTIHFTSYETGRKELEDMLSE